MMRLLLALVLALPLSARAAVFTSYPSASPLTGAEIIGPVRQGSSDVTMTAQQLAIYTQAVISAATTFSLSGSLSLGGALTTNGITNNGTESVAGALTAASLTAGQKVCFSSTSACWTYSGGGLLFQSSAGTEVDVQTTSGTAANYLTMHGNTAGFGPTIGADGSDANTPLNLTGKGLSPVQVLSGLSVPSNGVSALNFSTGASTGAKYYTFGTNYGLGVNPGETTLFAGNATDTFAFRPGPSGMSAAAVFTASASGIKTTGGVTAGGAIQVSGDYAYSAPATGATLTSTVAVPRVIANPSGTLASLTWVIPGTPADGTVVSFTTTQAITTFTINSQGAGILGNIGTIGAGTTATYRYLSAVGGWFRIDKPA